MSEDHTDFENVPLPPLDIWANYSVNVTPQLSKRALRRMKRRARRNRILTALKNLFRRNQDQ